MGMSRCYGGLRALLVLLCAVFLTFGAGVCAFGLWALIDNVGGDGARGGLGVLAAWGALLAAGAGLALRGGGGAAAVGTALLLGAGGGAAGAACWGATHLPALRAALHARLSHVVAHYSPTDHTDHRVLDALQQGLRCCGADGVRDWRASRYSLSDTGVTPDTAALDLTVLADVAHYRVPPSCCLEEDSEGCEAARRVPAGSAGGAGLYGGGCAEAAWTRLSQWGRWMFGAGAALLLALCVALLLQLVLCLHARPAGDKQLARH